MEGRKYPSLALYLYKEQEARAKSSPVQRIRNLNTTLQENGIDGGKLTADVRTQDGDRFAEYQETIGTDGVTINPGKEFDFDNAISGLVRRAVQAVENGCGHVYVEAGMVKRIDVLENLLQAVSDQLRRKMRFTARIIRDIGRSPTGSLDFRDGIRTKSKFEMALPQLLQGLIASLVEKVINVETIHPDDKGTVETCYTPSDFLRNYFNEWFWIRIILESAADEVEKKEVVSQAFKSQYDQHGVAIRKYRDFYPKRLHERACPPEIEDDIKELDELADTTNGLYADGALSKSKLLELTGKAQKICFHDL